jgi:hypothetical protein
VGRGATLNGIEIALLEVPAFSVRGIVVDGAGRPVDNASVMLMSDPSMGVSAMMAGGPGRAQTSADGQFRIDGVAAGVYLASAAAPLVAGAGVQGGTIRGVVGGISAGVSGGVVGSGSAVCRSTRAVMGNVREAVASSASARPAK